MLYKLLLNENYRGINIRIFKREEKANNTNEASAGEYISNEPIYFLNSIMPHYPSEGSEQTLYGYVCIEDFKELQNCNMTWRLRRLISRDINFVGKVGDDGPLDKGDFYIEESIYDYDYIENEDDRLEAYYEESYHFYPISYELEEEPWYIGIEEVYDYEEVDELKKDLYELTDYLLDHYCGKK